jgi:hypothetical protein
MTLTAVLLGLLGAVACFVVSTGVVMLLIVKLPADHFCRRRRRPGARSHPVWVWAAWIAKNLAGSLIVLVGIMLSLPGIPGPGLVLILLGTALVDFPGKHRLEMTILRRPGVARALNSFRAQYGKPPLVFDAGAPEPLAGESTEKERK